MSIGRPRPTDWLIEDLEDSEVPRFEPCLELAGWVHDTFLRAESELVNLDHSHLADARIGFLFTNVANREQGNQILGTAGIGRPSGKPWPAGRQEFQLRQWFGDVPDFLITLDGNWCSHASDIEFCALVEHELYHCAPVVDMYGEPKLDEFGNMRWRIQGHDVEEFAGVVERYGAWSPGMKMVERALREGPTVSRVSVAGACGTCLRVR